MKKEEIYDTICRILSNYEDGKYPDSSFALDDMRLTLEVIKREWESVKIKSESEQERKSINTKHEDEQKQEIIEIITNLEHELCVSHLEGDSSKKTHTCLYCGETSDWHKVISHKEDCPIYLINQLLKKYNIKPEWLRILES